MNTLTRQIHDEIRERGPISFARFMELALYQPGLGYYERPQVVGRDGDFFTSVSVGPLFGRLLAFQFALWMDSLCPAGDVDLVEAGAHQGALAADILSWLCEFRPSLFDRVHYTILEPSTTRRTWQEETLLEWRTRVKWAPGISALEPVNGVIFSNEFLDAIPVHVFAWSAGNQKWVQGCVASAGENFAWIWRPPEESLRTYLPLIPPELAEVLPDGFEIEICPLASEWWGVAASKLRRGKLLTFDYGLTSDERLHPQRARGTLRAYAKHHATADVLNQPGSQDLTSHIDFSALKTAGEAAGLRTETFVRQSTFLTEIMVQTQKSPGLFAAWDEKITRQFHTLTHPEHLGRKFRVLVQSRDVPPG